MGTEERLDKVSSEVATIKRWWPLVATCVVVALFLIKVTNSVTSTYDNTIAKKTDLLIISNQILVVSNQIKTLSDDFKTYKINQSVTKTIDSAERVKGIKDIDEHLLYADQQINTLIKEYKALTGYGENYHYDKRGKRVVTVVPVQ